MTATPTMTPFRPHLLRAFYEWLVANDLTPHLVVNADVPGVRVPRQYVKDGQIVLNIAPAAVGQLQLGDMEISFSVRFGGTPFAVRMPIAAAAAIYARENGAGTTFSDEPGLTLGDLAEEEGADQAEAAAVDLAVVASADDDNTNRDDDDNDGGDEPPPATPPKRRGGHLKVVK